MTDSDDKSNQAEPARSILKFAKPTGRWMNGAKLGLKRTPKTKKISRGQGR